MPISNCCAGICQIARASLFTNRPTLFTFMQINAGGDSCLNELLSCYWLCLLSPGKYQEEDPWNAKSFGVTAQQVLVSAGTKMTKFSDLRGILFGPGEITWHPPCHDTSVTTSASLRQGVSQSLIACLKTFHQPGLWVKPAAAKGAGGVVPDSQSATCQVLYYWADCILPSPSTTAHGPQSHLSQLSTGSKLNATKHLEHVCQAAHHRSRTIMGSSFASLLFH